MSEVKHEVIDVDDDLDVFCTGVRRCIRIDCPPSPYRHKKRPRDAVTISLVDSDSDDSPVPSSYPVVPQRRPHPPMDQRTELQRITQLELASRRTLHDARPMEERATDPIRMAVNAVDKSHINESKRREPIKEVIELFSDGEPEHPPSKKQKVDDHIGSPYDINDRHGSHGDMPKLESEFSRAELRSPGPSDQDHPDSDDDGYVDFLGSLNISDEANWVPLPERNKAEDLTPMHGSHASLARPQPLSPLHLPRKKPLVDYRHLSLDWAAAGPWGAISRNHKTRFPIPFYHSWRQERLFPRRSPSLYHETGYTKLHLTAKYPHLMSGSVNKIIQTRDTVVLCAVVDGGLEDSDDEDAEDRPPLPPENKPGSLIVRHRGRVHVAPAHHGYRDTSRGSMMKYYSVRDIAFSPLNPRQFLSSGYDLSVQTWEILDQPDDDECRGLDLIRTIPFESKPQDLLYSPDGSALAITFSDGVIRLYSEDLFEDMMDANSSPKKLCAAPKGYDHATGSTLWGEGFTKHLLFSSSESQREDDHVGFHHAFDTQKGVKAIQFDATECGDAAALSPDGATLVLVTCGDRSHPIRLYDVRNKQANAYETEELEKFRPQSHIDINQGQIDTQEVNQTIFSPDGLLLAVARSDNALHIYDVRALSRGPLCRFEHHDSDTVGGGRYGIVAVDWIQGRDRIGIASGGDDGCVRLWEPALGRTDEIQGAVIGRTDFDVGHFSIGDCQNGEFPLVIGDSGGGMHTYDFANEDGVRIY